MPIKVHIPTPMRQHTDGPGDRRGRRARPCRPRSTTSGSKYPGITQRMFDNGQLRRFVNLYLNDEDIRYLDNLGTPVKDGDELSIIPAVAGG